MARELHSSAQSYDVSNTRPPAHPYIQLLPASCIGSKRFFCA